MSYYSDRGYVLLTRQHQSGTAHVVVAWIAAVLSAGYLLPWAIAATRNKENAAAIALIDLLLGWSLVGWIVSLVMACSANPPVHTVLVDPYAGGHQLGPGGYPTYPAQPNYPAQRSYPVQPPVRAYRPPVAEETLRLPWSYEDPNQPPPQR